MSEADHHTWTGNLLLDSLDAQDRSRLISESPRVSIEVGKVLFYPGDAVTYVPFPLVGTLSMVTEPAEGLPVEAATIGLEGAGVVHSALGSRLAMQELVGQVEGEMITVPIQSFATWAEQPRFRALVFGYMEALIAQISLTAACNAVHHLNHRCARWLLQTHDRVPGDTFGLTQEFLGMMLGVQRPSVSIAQRTLQAAECITFTRGSITVVDRAALEAASCGCYEQIRTEYSKLVPVTGGAL